MGKKHCMRERLPNENSNERMADRPERDGSRLDETPLPLDDTEPEGDAQVRVDDV
jgi:hypothetical protein